MRIKIKNKIIGVLVTVLLVVQATPAYARIIFEGEFLLENSGNAWVIDSQNDATGNISLQFGGTLAETITYNTANSWFEFSGDISLGQNQIKNAAIENLANAPASPVTGQIYHNTTDANSYIWNGTGWDDITAINSTSTKVITIGTGLDYATIAAGATYLSGLSGGIMLLSAETHSITSAINLSNISLVGKDPTKTTISISRSEEHKSELQSH